MIIKAPSIGSDLLYLLLNNTRTLVVTRTNKNSQNPRKYPDLWFWGISEEKSDLWDVDDDAKKMKKKCWKPKRV